MIDKALFFYIGCALIPTPPSPCYDFSLQGVFVIIIGLIAPKFLIDPVTSFLFGVGRFFKHFRKVPIVGFVIDKTDKGFKLWKELLNKEAKPKNKHLRKLFKLIIKKDLIQRLLFGYFVSILIGIAIMLFVVFLL